MQFLKLTRGFSWNFAMVYKSQMKPEVYSSALRKELNAENGNGGGEKIQGWIKIFFQLKLALVQIKCNARDRAWFWSSTLPCIKWLTPKQWSESSNTKAYLWSMHSLFSLWVGWWNWIRSRVPFSRPHTTFVKTPLNSVDISPPTLAAWSRSLLMDLIQTKKQTRLTFKKVCFNTDIQTGAYKWITVHFPKTL